VTRAVLDTNVLVSAAIGSQGAPADCLRAHAEGLFDLIVSPALLRELRTVLARPRFLPYLDREQAERFVATLEQGALVTDDPPDPPPLSRDPDDDYLPALARASEAVVLVTGDRPLLAVEAADIRNVRPRTFLDLLSGRP
jgi:putative PIN family toxin of toxin-antitoxin system